MLWVLGAPETNFSGGEFPGWKERRGSDYGVGMGPPGMKGVSQRRDRAEMVASLAAVGQRMGTEQHPTIPYQHRPLSGIFHDVLALPCPRPLHTPS